MEKKITRNLSNIVKYGIKLVSDAYHDIGHKGYNKTNNSIFFEIGTRIS